MGEWDNIGQSSISQTGPKLNPGRSYLLEVAQALYKPNMNNGDFYIVEMCVHESDDPLLPPGTRPSWTSNKRHKPSPGNILCFNGAINGIDPSDEPRLRASITGQHIEYGISAANPYRGRFIRATTSEIQTKSDQDFTVVKWHVHGLAQLPPSKLNDAPVAAGVAPSAPAAPAPAPVSMPGAFAPPQMPGLPSFPQNGLPMPMGLSTMPPAMGGGVPPMGGAPMPPPPVGMPPVGAPSLGLPPPIGMPPIGMPPIGMPPIPAPKPWPPTGWQAHTTPGYFWQPTTGAWKTEADLRAAQAAGQV